MVQKCGAYITVMTRDHEHSFTTHPTLEILNHREKFDANAYIIHLRNPLQFIFAGTCMRVVYITQTMT